MSHPAQPKGLGEVLSNVLTGLLGIAAFVYLTGAAVLWARLLAIEVPANPVVAGLPRELLVATGLRTVVLPSLALALVALAGFGVGKVWDRSKSGRSIALSAFLTSAVVALLIAGLVVGPKTWALGWTAGAFLAFFVGYFGSAAVRPRDASGLAVAAMILLAVGLVGAVTRFLVELRVPDLPGAVVCVKDGGSRYRGLLIGETSDAVYIGQREKKRVVSIPKDRIGELWIGSAKAGCTVPKPISPAPPPPSSGKKP